MRLRSLILCGCLLPPFTASADPLPRIPCTVEAVTDGDSFTATDADDLLRTVRSEWAAYRKAVALTQKGPRQPPQGQLARALFRQHVGADKLPIRCR